MKADLSGSLNERIIRMAHTFTMQTRPNDFDFHPPFPIIHTSVSWLRSNAVPLALLFRCRPPVVSHAFYQGYATTTHGGSKYVVQFRHTLIRDCCSD